MRHQDVGRLLRLQQQTRLAHPVGGDVARLALQQAHVLERLLQIAAIHVVLGAIENVVGVELADVDRLVAQLRIGQHLRGRPDEGGLHERQQVRGQRGVLRRHDGAAARQRLDLDEALAQRLLGEDAASFRLLGHGGEDDSNELVALCGSGTVSWNNRLVYYTRTTRFSSEATPKSKYYFALLVTFESPFVYFRGPFR